MIYFFSLPFDPYLNNYLLLNIHLTNIMIHLSIQVDGPKGSKLFLKKKKTEHQASCLIKPNRKKLSSQTEQQGSCSVKLDNQQVARSSLVGLDLKDYILI